MIGISYFSFCFFVQADSVLKDSILVLRQENALLMVEINELKVDLGLREDQVREWLCLIKL